MDSPCIKQTVCKVLKIFQYGKYLVAYVLNGDQTNGTSQQYSDNSVLINMITQMNKEFSARLCSIENCLTKLGKIENEVAMARAEVANIKADNSNFNGRLLDVR